MSLEPDDVPNEDGFKQFMAELRNNGTSGRGLQNVLVEDEGSGGVIKKEALAIVQKDSPLKIGNSQYDNRKLKEFNFIPFSSEDIKYRAELFVNKQLKYKLFKINCEHFATFVRYNISISDQVEKYLKWAVQKKRITRSTKYFNDLMNQPPPKTFTDLAYPADKEKSKFNKQYQATKQILD
ncbi:HRSL2 protein, partial [Polypterus senegalus]|nr:HRSL2 protein [Polypterus senegalus]